jgi:hypothetical protein
LKKKNNLTSRYIKSKAKHFGFLNKDLLELHYWIYDLFYQIQKRTNNRCILKGGAASQLHLPVDWQRCTNDIDCATDLSPKELQKVMKSIKDDFTRNGLNSSYREYIPRNMKPHHRIIPMMTFIFDIPFVFKTKKRIRYPGIKIDFLFLNINKLHKTKLISNETLGLKLNYVPIAIDKYSTISDKLITLASNSLGLENFKLEALYKNIYDLYCLINTYNDLESFKIISDRIKDSLNIELEIKKGEYITVDLLLKDILFTLYDIATFSLKINHSELPLQIKKFQDNTMQKEVREKLNVDMWSVMCLYLYIWVFSIKTYINDKDYSKLQGINSVIDQYEYFSSLMKKERRAFKRDLKDQIKIKDPNLILEGTGNPLRLIYLNYILDNLKPNWI